jgi:hypothetical protein
LYCTLYIGLLTSQHQCNNVAADIKKSFCKKNDIAQYTWFGKSTSIIGAANRKNIYKGEVRPTVSRTLPIRLNVAIAIG